MKEFMFLFIGGHESLSKLSPEEMQQHMEKWNSWIGKMREEGIYKAGNPLEREAQTIAGMERIVTDGPFAEAKEVVGGYIIITAQSMDHAVQTGKGCPIFENGGRVEVRQVKQLDM